MVPMITAPPPCWWEEYPADVFIRKKYFKPDNELLEDPYFSQRAAVETRPHHCAQDEGDGDHRHVPRFAFGRTLVSQSDSGPNQAPLPHRPPPQARSAVLQDVRGMPTGEGQAQPPTRSDGADGDPRSTMALYFNGLDQLAHHQRTTTGKSTTK